jgi:hypothetical protein
VKTISLKNREKLILVLESTRDMRNASQEMPREKVYILEGEFLFEGKPTLVCSPLPEHNPKDATLVEDAIPTKKK